MISFTQPQPLTAMATIHDYNYQRLLALYECSFQTSYFPETTSYFPSSSPLISQLLQLRHLSGIQKALHLVLFPTPFILLPPYLSACISRPGTADIITPLHMQSISLSLSYFLALSQLSLNPNGGQLCHSIPASLKLNVA